MHHILIRYIYILTQEIADFITLKNHIIIIIKSLTKFFTIVSFYFSVTTLATPAGAEEMRTRHEMLSSFVRSGTEAELWRQSDIDKNCETYRGFSVDIERLPKFGTANLRKIGKIITDRWITFRTGNNKRKHIKNCLGRSVPVIMVYYTPNPGYSGFDDLKIVTTNPRTRVRRHVEFRIAVR